MNRFPAFLASSAAVILSAAGSLLIGTAGGVEARPDTGLLRQPGATATPAPSSCVHAETKYVDPHVLLMGEATTITLRSSFVCANLDMPLHVVLVLDGSGSASGALHLETKQAGKAILSGLDLVHHPTTMVGVVGFDETARVYTYLTNDEARALGAINQLGSQGRSVIDAGIREGLAVLARGRGKHPEGEVAEVLVLLSDGGNNAGCAPVLEAAAEAKGDGILVASVCIGPGCWSQCMRQVASAPHYFHQAQNVGLLATDLEQMRDAVAREGGVELLTIADELPANMALERSSIEPAPKAIGRGGSLVTWEFSDIPREGVTITFEIVPQEPGYWPTNLAATGVFTDVLGHTGSFRFALPMVRVLDTQPHPTSTATELAATPTSHPSPSPTAREDEKPIYLPVCRKADG